MNSRYEDREAGNAAEQHQNPERADRVPRGGDTRARAGRDRLEATADRLGDASREEHDRSGRSQCGEHQAQVTPAITVRFFATKQRAPK